MRLTADGLNLTIVMLRPSLLGYRLMLGASGHSSFSLRKPRVILAFPLATLKLGLYYYTRSP